MTDSTNMSAEAAVNAAPTDDLNSTADTAASGSAPEAPRIQLAQAVVEVPMPNPGETVTITVAPGQTLRLGFDYAAAGNGEVLENGNLVLPVNGGQVIIEGFADAATFDPPVELTNNDGTVIELGDFLVAIDVPLDVLVETAAGTPGPIGPLPETTAPNQGAGFTPGEGPQILGGLGPEGPVDPTALQYRVPEREQTIFDLEEGDGPNADDDGPGTDNEAVCVDESLLDGGEGGNGYDISGVVGAEGIGVDPVEGNEQFFLSAQVGVPVSAIEAFFGLAPDTLRNFQGGQETEDGGAMRTEVTVEAGDTLTFSFNFLDAESPGQLTFIDLAVVVIGDQVFKLADVNDATDAGPDGLLFSFNEQTGYLTFNYVFPAGGTFQLGFAVMNEDDTSVDPGLLIDDIVITGPGGDKFVDGFEAGAGNWQLLEAFSQTTVSDNVLDNDDFGPDGPGGIVGITYLGGDSADPLTVTDDGGSPVITFTANDGSNNIWTLQFNLDTGDYTFTLLAPYQHSGPGADEAHEQFVYTIVDSNGDTDSATLSICIQDDVPTVFIGGEGSVTLDETDNDGDDGDIGGLLATQTFSVGSLFFINTDFGADGPGDVEFALVLSTPGADSGLVDTATGDPVVLALESGDVVGRNGEGDEVFRIHLDTDTNEITVTQSRAVVHDDPNDPDESGSPESILGGLVGLQATITDDDGDTDTDIAELGALIRFEDDGPSVSLSGAEGAAVLDESLGTDITDPNAADEQSAGAALGAIGFDTFSAASLFTVNAGSDGEQSRSYAFTLSGPDADSGLVDTLSGDPVLLNLVGGEIVGTNAADEVVLRISIDTTTGEVTVNQFRAVEHDDPNDPDESGSPESIAAGVVGVELTVTDGDGDTDSETADLGSHILFEDDGPSVTLSGAEGTAVLDESVGADIADPNADDETNPDAAPGAIGFGTLASAALFTVDAGTDGEQSRSYAFTLSGPDADSGLVDTLSGDPVLLNLVGGEIVGTNAADEVVLRISIDTTTGEVTVNQFRAVEHDDPNDPDESSSPESIAAGVVGVELTVTDGDDDTDSETVDIGPRILFEDDGPTAGDIGGGEGLLRLDESVGYDFADGNANDEDASIDPNDIGFASSAAGSFFAGGVEFGSDGPGDAATFELLLSENGANSGLVHTESGHPIFLFDNGGVIEGREGTDALDAATGTIVFTVSIVGGNVEVHQYEAVVHDDAPTDHDENDDPESINEEVLGLTVAATDGDNDPVTVTIDLGPKILFEDDGPTASLAPKTEGGLLTLDESVGADAGDLNAADETDPDAAPGAIGFSSAFVSDLFNETAEFGEDGPGGSGTGKTYELTLSASGADSGMDDTATGADILLFLEGGAIVGRAGTETVFTITIDANTGEIEVNQFRAVEHDDTNDHDESTSPETIDAGLVGVKLTVTDGDDDVATSATAELGQLIKFEDDGPTAVIEPKVGAEIRLDETDNDADDGAPGGLLATRTVTIASLFTTAGDPGSDGDGGSSGSSLSAANPNTGLVDTLSGQAVVLVALDAFTIVGQTAGGGLEVFRVTLNTGTGEITVTQSRAVEHDDPADPDEATSPETINPNALLLNVTVTDGDGDHADDSVDLGQLIKFEDDGPTVVGEGGQTTTVDEDDLPTGTDGTPESLIVTGDIGVDFGSDGPGDVSGITGPAGLFSNGVAVTYSFNAATNTLTGSAGATPIFTVSIDPASGEYTFELKGPIDHDGASKALGFNFTVTDGDDDPVNGSFTVNVTDDGPVPQDDTATVNDAGGTTTNLVIVFDRSGSMDEDSGVEGFATRMDLAREAIAQLMNSYNTFGPVNIKIVDFAGEPVTGPAADSSLWFTGPDAVQQAIDYLAGLQPEGNTDYGAAVTEAQSSYDQAGDPAPAADQQFVYFISDGNPTVGGDATTHELTAPQIAAWESFLTTNTFDKAFAVGVGTNVSVGPLDDVAFPNGDPGNPIIVSDEADLGEALLGTVNPGEVSDNVLTNDAFGVDGPDGGVPYVKSIVIGADTYVYDPATGNVTKNGGAFGNTTITDVATDFGKLTFNFATGAYTYKANDVTGNQTETFTYTVVDDDGTEASADLIVNINDVDTSVLARDDRIITNIGNASVLIPAAALLFNDFHFDDGATLSISAVENALGGSVGLVLGGNVQFDKTANDGAFDYTASDGGAGSDDAHVTISTDTSGPLGGTNDREILIANNSGVTVNAGGGSDFVIGGTGTDSLNGEAGADVMFGGGGVDALTGGVGGDYLDGGNDGVADTLNGGAGDDILVLWTNDIAHGGDDSDMIILKDNLNFGSVDGGFAVDVQDDNAFQPNGGMTNHRGDILVFDGFLNFDGPNAAEVATGRQVSGIETISMQDHEFVGSADAGNDTLTLQAADVIAMGTGTMNPDQASYGEDDTIRVDGDAGDVLNLTGGNWINLAANPDTPAGYTLWAHDPSGIGTNEDAYVLVQTVVTVNAS